MSTPQPPAAEPRPDADAGALSELVLALINSRHSVAPKRLSAPGPSAEQLRRLLEAAASAPDHRGLQPWRLVRIADHQRDALADLFEACSRDRVPPPAAPDATVLANSRAKAYRAPTLLLAVLRSTPPDPEVPDTERAVALGAGLMAMLLAAHGLGLAGMLTSGRALRSARFAQAFALGEHERAVCFVSLGTADAPRRRARGDGADRLSDWAGPPPA